MTATSAEMPLSAGSLRNRIYVGDLLEDLHPVLSGEVSVRIISGSTAPIQKPNARRIVWIAGVPHHFKD